MANQRLHKALLDQKKSTEQSQLKIFGTLGIPLGGRLTVDVADRPSFVYVRLRTDQNEVVQAFNNTVAPSYGLPVIVQRDGTRYIVLGVDTLRYQNNWTNNAPFLPRHGTTHSFDPNGGGGGDMVWVYSRQFMPLLVYPSGTFGSSAVSISNHIIQNPLGKWMYVGDTGTANLISYAPPSGAFGVMILVYMDRTTGNPGIIVNSGNYFSNTLTTAQQIAPYIPNVTNSASQIPLGAVRITTGTTTIDWSYIYDVRPFLSFVATGTSGGGGGGGGAGMDQIGIYGLNKGVPLGTGTWVDFGNNITPTISGTTLRVDVTVPSAFNGIPVYKDGQFIGTGTSIDFEQNLYVSITGTTVFVRNPVTTYQRFDRPIPILGVTGMFWQVPEGIYASGSLGVFYNGVMQAKGVHYDEHLWVSGTYQLYFVPATGTYHMVSYGIPCLPQVQTSTGTSSPNSIVDSNTNLLLDSNSVQLVDSNG